MFPPSFGLCRVSRIYKVVQFENNRSRSRFQSFPVKLVAHQWVSNRTGFKGTAPPRSPPRSPLGSPPHYGVGSGVGSPPGSPGDYPLGSPGGYPPGSPPRSGVGSGVGSPPGSGVGSGVGSQGALRWVPRWAHHPALGPSRWIGSSTLQSAICILHSAIALRWALHPALAVPEPE